MSRREQEVLPTESIGCLAGLVRIIWLMVGNGALFLLTALIVEEGAFSGLDIAFWAIVVGLIMLRYIDITRLDGRTADAAAAASLKDWRRYALLLLMIAGGVWTLAHGIGRWLTS